MYESDDQDFITVVLMIVFHLLTRISEGLFLRGFCVLCRRQEVELLNLRTRSEGKRNHTAGEKQK